MQGKQREKTMDDVDALLESLYTLYAKLAALRAIQGPELLLPGRTKSYRGDHIKTGIFRISHWFFYMEPMG